MSVNVWDREVPFVSYQTVLYVNGDIIDTTDCPGFSLVGWTVPEVVYQIKDTAERPRAEFLYRVTVAEYITRFLQLVDLGGGKFDRFLTGSDQSNPVKFRVEIEACDPDAEIVTMYRREFLAWMEPEGIATAMPQAGSEDAAKELAGMLFPAFDMQATIEGAADVLSADALASVAAGALATYVLFQQMERDGIIRHEMMMPDEPGVGFDSGRWSPELVPQSAAEDIEWLAEQAESLTGELEAWLAEQPGTDN